MMLSSGVLQKARARVVPLFVARSFSSVKEVKKVGVVGLGLMGHGVAQVSAAAGFEVLGIESNEDAMNAGVKRIDESLGKMISKDVKKGKMTKVVFIHTVC